MTATTFPPGQPAGVSPLPSAAPVRLAALTALRGIAAWWVVLFHFREAIVPDLPGFARVALDHGYLAVDLFFVLSGFVIALGYLSSPQPTPAAYAHFLCRRLARIYPLHVVVLLLWAILHLAVQLWANNAALIDRQTPGYFILSLLLIQNWGFTHDLSWNVPAWSISTEWAAYLLFPLFAAISSMVCGRRGRCMAAAGAFLAVLSAVHEVAGAALGDQIPQLGLLRCICEFGAGVCLFELWRLKPELGPIALIAVALVGAGLVVGVTTGLAADHMVLPMLFVVLVYLTASDRHTLGRALCNPVMQFIGEISYSTYLLHYLVKFVVKFLFVRDGLPYGVAFTFYVVITASVSVLFYKAVEIPGRKQLMAWLNLPLPSPNRTLVRSHTK